MLTIMAAIKPTAAGAVTVNPLNDHVVDVVYSGRVDANLIQQSMSELLALHKRSPVRWLLIDATNITGIDPSMRSSASEAMQAVKDNGMQVIAVVNVSAARMLGSALAFAVGLPLRLVPTRADALALLRAEKAL
jgi:anti-anti-sigma regulatory factor